MNDLKAVFKPIFLWTSIKILNHFIIEGKKKINDDIVSAKRFVRRRL